VCLLADEYPNPESMFGWDDPHTQAAMLISDLIQNMDKQLRVNQVIECIKYSATLQFQLEIFRWLRKEEEDKPEKDCFSSEEIEKIGQELAKKIESYIKASDDMTVEARILPHTFYLLNKYSKKQIVIDHVSSLLKKDESAIIRLLDSYTPTAWGMETGVSHKSDFDRDQYNSITTVFDPEFLLESIKSYLGVLPEDQEQFPRDFEYTDRSILLNQFVWIHRRVLKEKSEEEA